MLPSESDGLGVSVSRFVRRITIGASLIGASSLAALLLCLRGVRSAGLPSVGPSELGSWKDPIG